MESPGPRASFGGWGLGEGHEENCKAVEEDDEDETLNWDEAQVCQHVLLQIKYIDMKGWTRPL